MNKVLLMGRLTRDPETKYSQSATPVAVTRYTLAVNRRFKKQGEPDADFINCIAFGKSGEFVSKYFTKGQLVSVVGSIRTGSYDKDGVRVYTTDVITDEHYFAESAKKSENIGNASNQTSSHDGFYPIDETLESDDLPF